MDIINEVNSILVSKPYIYEISDSELKYKFASDIHFKILLNEHSFELVSDKDYLAQHIIRLLHYHFKTNSFSMQQEQVFDVFESLIKFMNDPYRYCTISGVRIDFIGEQISCSPENIDKFCELVTDNIISDNMKRNILVLYFLVKTAIYAVDSSKADKVFNPRLPNTDINNIKKLINDNQLELQIQNMSKNVNDIDDNYIHKKIGAKLYAFIKYTIISNKTYITSEKFNEGFEFEQEKLDQNSFKRIMNFHVIHDEDKSKIFEQEKKHFFVFHGSDIGNWYSIMRNGLKNYSGTGMMAHGAAFGKGIYLANNIEMAYGYSTNNFGMGYDRNTYLIVAVVQLLDKDNYDKKNGIFVVPDEDKILLKNLALVDYKNIKELQNYYDKLSMNIYNLSNLETNLLLKRMNSEYKLMTKFMINNKDYDIICDTSEIRQWKMNIKNKTNNKFVTFIIIFTVRYPTESPILKLIETNSEYIELTTTSYKYIMLKQLDASQWSIKHNVAYITSLIINRLIN